MKDEHLPWAAEEETIEQFIHDAWRDGEERGHDPEGAFRFQVETLFTEVFRQLSEIQQHLGTH